MKYLQKRITDLATDITKAEQELVFASATIDAFDPSEHYTENMHIDFLNENYGTVEVCGYTMDSGNVLFDRDYTAFRESLNNYIDSLDYTEFYEYNVLMEKHKEIEEEIEELEELMQELMQELEELIEEQK